MEFRRHQPEDFAGLMDLVASCYGKRAEPPEWWTWRHFENRAQETTIWLAIEGPRVIGMRPLTLFDYCLSGQTVKGALFSAVMVHPEFRRRGVFTRLISEATADAWRQGAIFATTMPNDESYPAYVRIGWSDLGDRILLIRGTDPLRAEAGRTSRLRLRLITALARILLRGSRAERTVAGKSTAIAEVTCFPEETALAVSRFTETFRGSILYRNVGWLNWRFASRSWNQYTRLLSRSENGHLSGFAVTNTERRDGLMLGYVVDLVADSEEMRGCLIHRACEQLEEAGAELIMTVVSPGILSSAFQNAGFLKIPSWLSPKRFHTVYQTNPSHTGRTVPSRIEHWYQTLGDWDGI